MNFKNFIKEDFEQWNGRWIHYSNGMPRSPESKEKIPSMQINYKMMWSDPFGIYFFPEKFESQTKGSWHNYEFKYIVEFPPGMRVFDMSKFSIKEFEEILDKNNIRAWEGYHDDLRITPADWFWHELKRHFNDAHTGGVKKAKINKFFRDMGYDAIFDDTNAIFHGETQLILLNPSVKYKVIDIKRRRTSGWEELSQIIDRVEQLCKSYGNVQVSRDNKKYSGWDSGYVLKARVTVNGDKWKEGPYVSWEIYTTGIEKGSPTEVRVCLSGATPRLPELFRSSECSTIQFRTMDLSDLSKFIPKIMQKIWQNQTAAA